MADTTTTDNSNSIWIPLESDPTILTEYLRTLSLTSNYFIDIPSIDLVEEMGIFEFHDILAYIFLFPIEKHGNLGQVERDPILLQKLFYMKQLIANSCGSVALLHAFLNTIPADKLARDSFLQRFYLENIDKTPEERGKAFASSQMVHQRHHDMAMLGQSTVPSEDQLSFVELHFVSFVPFNGILYELDGRREGPINHGRVEQDQFKREALKIIKQYMSMNPDSLSFSVLALC